MAFLLVAEAKREEKGEDITTVEKQSVRYAKSTPEYSCRRYYWKSSECIGIIPRVEGAAEGIISGKEQ